MNLFAPLSENSKKDVLVEFKAGRMHFRTDGTKWVECDKRKGLVQIKQSPEDNLIHFIWKDRTTGTEDINLMLFPEDASFRRVNEANGRVYVLEWSSTDKKMFFWMQEPKDDKDKENCENINKFINNPPQPSADAGLGDLGGVGNMGLNRAQILQLLGGNSGSIGGLSNILSGMQGTRRGPSTQSSTQQTRANTTNTQSSSSSSSNKPATTTNTSAPQASQTNETRTIRPPTFTPPANNALQLDTLQQLLSQITHSHPKEPSLKDIINVDEILASGLFDRPEVVAKLAEYLPEGQVNAENLRENIRSPQFQQAVSMFNQALRTGQLAGIMSSFGLDPSSLGPHSTIEDFLRAIQKKVESEKEKSMDTSD